MEEIRERELLHAREAAVLALVGGGDESLLRRDARVLAPGFVHAHLVDAAAPGVEGHVHRLVATMPVREFEQAAGREVAHPAQRRLDRAQHVRIDAAAQMAAQQRVGVVLIGELRGLLQEAGVGRGVRWGTSRGSQREELARVKMRPRTRARADQSASTRRSRATCSSAAALAPSCGKTA